MDISTGEALCFKVLSVLTTYAELEKQHAYQSVMLYETVLALQKHSVSRFSNNEE